MIRFPTSLRSFFVADRFEFFDGRDMHHRVAHWRTLVKMGWELPPHNPMSRPEAIEEERLRQAMLEAQKQVTEEDLQAPLRTFRIIVGIKGVECRDT